MQKRGFKFEKHVSYDLHPSSISFDKNKTASHPKHVFQT